MNDRFSQFHPIVNLTFYVAVIAFTMFLMNPVCLGISLCCALANAIYLNGVKTLRFGVRIVLPSVILVSVINPIVNHQGVTILEYLPWNNPLTLESILYGIASSVMVSAVVFWFSSVNTVMTSDKFIYLFGRIIPSLSLVLSMALRFVPRFLTEFRQIRAAQKQLSVAEHSGFFSSLRQAARELSTMLSYALENSIETADSMKARGYGLKGRTSYAKYRFYKQDVVFFSCLLLLFVLLLILSLSGAVRFRYFPSLKGDLFTVNAILFYVLYCLLMLTPLVLNIGEGIRWKRLRSKI